MSEAIRPFRARITSESVLTPRLRNDQRRFQELVADHCMYMHIDNEYTTSASIAMVLLASVVANTRCPSQLSAVTGFYVEFVETIVTMMNTSFLWEHPTYITLQKAASRPRPRSSALADASHHIAAVVSNSTPDKGWRVWLDITRGHLICGGGLQPYLDQVLVDEKHNATEKSIYLRSFPDAVAGSTLYSARQRIAEFLADQPDQQVTVGDDAATTYGCVGLILFALALTGSKSPLEIATVTGFLREFPDLIIYRMSERNLWNSEWYRDLVATASATELSARDVAGSLQCALERFYSEATDHLPHNELELARSRLLFGGLVQGFSDHSYFGEFIENAGSAQS